MAWCAFVRQGSLWYWGRVVPLLQHGWQVGRRRMRDLWQQADTLVTPLSERPLWCVTAGLLAGSLLGTALDLSLLPLGAALLLAGLVLLLPWPMPQLQRCCRLGLVGLTLTALQLAWQIDSLPAHHIARVLPSLPRHVTVEGILDRAV